MTEEELDRQREALQSVTALRDELVETAPGKFMRGMVTVVAIGVVAYFLLGRK